MKEFEEVAKAISLGMKALAKIIETAADQLEEHIQDQPGKEEAQEVRKSPQKKTEAKKKVKAEKPEALKPSEESAPETEAEKAPEESAPEAETEKAFERELPKAKDAKARKPSGKSKKKNKKKTRKPSDTQSVYLHIQAAKEGIHLDELNKATGFDKKKLYNIIHRLKKSGKIKNIEKAVYTAV
jgi:hypothetical protein